MGKLGDLIGRIKTHMPTSTSMEQPAKQCPVGKCDGSGWIDQGRLSRECPCQERERKRARVKRLFGEAGIPRRYAGQTLGRLDPKRQPHAMDAARRYVRDWQRVADEGRWLYLFGPVGTGKTALAYAILQELLAQGVPGVAETVPELMDRLRPGDGQERERMATLKSVDLLVLDDLGAEKASDWVAERLFVVLDARYRDMRPTVLTSNERIGQLASLSGWGRIADRIAGTAEMVGLGGESYRIEEARRRRGGA